VPTMNCQPAQGMRLANTLILKDFSNSSG